MATPIKWHGVNKVLHAPKGDEDRVMDLHVFNNGVVTVSVWEFTPEEIEEIVQRGHTYVAVFSGPSSPPIFVGSEDKVREMAVDTGKTWKSYERVLKEAPKDDEPSNENNLP